MKVKLGTLNTTYESFVKILKLDFNSLITFKLLDINTIIETKLKNLEEVRIRKVKEYGTPIDNKGNYQVTQENQEKFFEEYNTLVNEEIELPDVKLTRDNFFNLKIDAKTIQDLELWLIEKPRKNPQNDK